MISKKWHKEIEVDINLELFTDNELLHELQNRGIDNVNSISQDLEVIYNKIRLAQNYDQELADLLYKTIGKII